MALVFFRLRCVQRLADPVRELMAAIRLRQQLYAGIKTTVVNYGIFCITRGIEHLEIGPQQFCCFGQLASVHAPGIAEYYRQQVIEIVRDSAGKLARRCEAL